MGFSQDSFYLNIFFFFIIVGEKHTTNHLNTAISNHITNRTILIYNIMNNFKDNLKSSRTSLKYLRSSQGMTRTFLSLRLSY